LIAELCLRTGEIDVFRFMENVDPRVVDFWEAYDDMYPINSYDEHKREFASMITMLHRFMNLFASSHGVQLDVLHENDFLPKRLRYKVEHSVQTSSDIEQKVVSGLRLIK